MNSWTHFGVTYFLRGKIEGGEINRASTNSLGGLDEEGIRNFNVETWT